MKPRRFQRSNRPEIPPVTLKMEKMAQGGDALSHLEDGRVCFVSGAISGELATVRLTQNKKDYAKGVAEKILEPSADRVVPACPFYGKCGGCSLEHASPDFQLRSYREAVEELFRRFAKTELPASWRIASGEPYFYRNRARLVRVGIPGKPKSSGFRFRPLPDSNARTFRGDFKKLASRRPGDFRIRQRRRPRLLPL